MEGVPNLQDLTQVSFHACQEEMQNQSFTLDAALFPFQAYVQFLTEQSLSIFKQYTITAPRRNTPCHLSDIVVDERIPPFHQ